MEQAEPVAARAWMLLIELMQAERPRIAALCASFGITQVELYVVKSLKDGDGCGKMQDLINFHDKSTITRAVGALVKRGLVARHENPEDRREKLVELTPEGEAFRDRLFGDLKVPPRSLSALSIADRRTLVEVLERALGAEPRK